LSVGSGMPGRSGTSRVLRANSWAACGGSACAVAALGYDVLVVEQLSELFAWIDNRNAGTGRNGVLLASNLDGRPRVERRRVIGHSSNRWPVLEDGRAVAMKLTGPTPVLDDQMTGSGRNVRG
jgi:hypothetical protein